MNKTQEALKRVNKAEKEGYYIVSRKHKIASRIDRDDWKEYMAIKHAPWDYEQGLEWVNALGKHAGDFYRRVYSKDTITIPSSWLKLMKNSNEAYSK